MAKDRIDIQYRGHRIIANDTGAMIYPQKYELDGNSSEECLSSAKEYIDSKYTQRIRDRRAPHIGTVDDYSEALGSLRLGKHEVAMLSAHRKASGRKMTATKLSESNGWNGVSPANNHYGKLGKRISEHLSLKINGDDDQAWTEALAQFDENTREWEMHEELGLALERLNIA